MTRRPVFRILLFTASVCVSWALFALLRRCPVSADVVQLPIRWPNTEHHPAVRSNDPDTCVEPSQPRMSNGRLKALAAHYLHPDGLTDFELAAITDTAQTSIGVRRAELVKAGLVIGTTERRPSPSGSLAIVWRITSQGVGFIVRLNDKEAVR